MSREILEKVKSFLVQLVKDESFRNQLMSEKVEDVKKIMADGGYKFSRDEFETAAIQILELKELGQFQDLTEDELVGAIGGFTVSGFSKNPIDIDVDIDIDKNLPIIQPMYGIPIDFPEDIDINPCLCICKKFPQAITHYGSSALIGEEVDLVVSVVDTDFFVDKD